MIGTFALVADFRATIPSVSIARAFTIEAGFTGLPGFVIMSVATDQRTPSFLAPIFIGATVYVGALVTGPLTGGSFNPARTLGPALIGSIWTAHWLYWVAPIAGMVAGMWLYEFLREARIPAVDQLPIGVEGPIYNDG